MAQEIRAAVANGVKRLEEEHGVTPGLAAVLVGDNPASATYIRGKERACREVGIFTLTHYLKQTASQEELLQLVHHLNGDGRFHGILIQLPLPPQINERAIIWAIDPDKDVDGLHPQNMGRLMDGEPRFVPGTPAGVQQMLLRSGYDPGGKHVVVCGRSAIVGKPLALLLMQKKPGANATVTVCHTATVGLGAITREADILVVAVGRPGAVTADMVKDGAVVIDVGVNRVEDPTAQRGYRLMGDVAFAEVAEKASAISPVPGGVGPMTIAMLLWNTLLAAQLKLGIEE